MMTTQTQVTTIAAATPTLTPEPQNTTISTQTPEKTKDTVTDNCVSRVDPKICIQEVQEHNIEPPTTGTTLENIHEMITEELVATVEKATNTTESEEDMPLFRQKLQRVLSVQFIAAATKKDRNLRPSSILSERGRQSRLPTAITGITSETDSMSERIAY